MVLAIFHLQSKRGGKEVISMADNKRCRSAITGKFVTKSYANKNPKTTVKETVKKSKH